MDPSTQSDYQPLPLKYRPRTWDDVVGQKHAVAILRNTLTGGRVFSSYIFSGVAGCGKTTSARAFAMSLNCENLQDANPCLECISCTSALKFQNPDIVEIDGPSYSGVSHMRELKERAIYAPQFSKRVFIIDEVHALSRDAFQALLKLLEEPPSHVVFIMATTEPEKIPATIHSRSIRLDFRRHTERDVLDRLLHIATLESLDLEEEAALLIARYADGQLRDSITVLDQLAVAHPATSLTPELVAKELGIVSGTELHTIMDGVIQQDAVKLEEAVMATLERSTEFGMIVRAISDWYRDALRLKAGAAAVIRRSQSDRELLEKYAALLDFSHLTKALNICWEMADKVRFSGSNPRTFFLTGLYRLMLLKELTDEETQGPPEELPQQVAVAPPEPSPSAFSAPGTADLSDLEEELRSLTG